MLNPGNDLIWQGMSARSLAGDGEGSDVGASLAVLRASDGAQLWRIATNLHDLSIVEQITVTGDSVYLYIEEPATEGPNPQPPGNTDAHLAALGANSISQRWLIDFGPTIDVTAGVIAAPVVANGVVYVGLECCADSSSQSGSVVLYALHIADGSQLWRYQLPPAALSSGSALVSGPMFADGALYFSSSNGSVSAVRASDHTLLWQQQPATAGGALILAATDQALFVQTSASVLALRPSDGRTIWQFGQ